MNPNRFTLETDYVEQTGYWHCTVTLDEEIVHTTEGYEDEQSARWAANDWINGKYF